MNRLPRPKVALPAVLLTLLVTALSAAPASALDDPWARWTVPATSERDAWARSLDYIGVKLFAGTEGDGIFTQSAPLTQWAPANGGLNTVESKQVRQVVSKGSTLYAATSEGLFKSTNNASSWTQLGLGAPPRRLTMGGIQTVVANSASDLVVGTASFGVYYSSDSGAHWDRATGLPASESVFYIVASPANASLLYAAASDGVFISTNSGRSWTISSDGLPFADVLRVAVNPANPSLIYAATTGGLYRSQNGGLTWRAANGTGATALPANQVRAITFAPPSFGDDGAKVIVGTEKGVWASKDSGKVWGSMGKDAFAAEPPMSNQIVWALSVAFSPPKLLAGTQANGVYQHAFVPITSDAQPAVTPKTGLRAGMTVSAYPGAWLGTKPFFFAYQWKRCGTDGAGCSNIEGAKGKTYNLVAADIGHKIRVAVTASNIVSPVPVTKFSPPVPTTGTVLSPPAAAPQPSSGKGPSITPRDASYPWGQVYTISTGTWNVNGTTVAPTFKYQWRRCTEGGTCTTLDGQTAKTYTSVGEDVGNYLEAYVTATFNNASAIAYAGKTFKVIQKTPVNTDKPRIFGTKAVGQVLTSTVGAWDAVTPTFTRRWLACESDGLGCNPIFGATYKSFKLTNAQLGKRIKLEVTATSPDPTSVDRKATAFSALTVAVK